jgi:putative endonuclease
MNKTEHIACEYLQQQGLKLITQNFHSYFGELDLVMQDGDVLVFVEVRQRSQQDFGGAAGSIDRHKQHSLIRTAQYYLMKQRHLPPCRFDVVLMDKHLNIEWLKNAFDTDLRSS